MACPLCGDRCTCSFAPGVTRADASASSSLTYEYDDEYRADERPVKTEIPDTVFVSEDAAFSSVPVASEEPLSSSPAAPPEDLTFESARPAEGEEPGPLWKQEVASRLESYRARRGGRRPRYNGSMSLDFDRAANRMIASALAAEEASQAADLIDALEHPVAAEDRNEYFGSSAEPDPAIEETQFFSASSKPVPVTKVLEFPRLVTLFDATPLGNELAEPVVDKPRILYVPEEVPTAQAPLADIQIEPEERPAFPDIQLPLLVAPMGRRIIAGLIDVVIVLAAAVVFMAVVLRVVPAPASKLGYMLVAALPAVFWAIYEYLFLVHCGGTPGMQIAHLALASFDSEPIGRRLRRARALAWMLSIFPLGLGIIWALLDEDALCWHDRITRTYLVGVATTEY